MKVALGHLGSVTYALKSSLESLGVEVLLSPPNSEIMHRLSQEYMHSELCYPLKLLLGNYLYNFDARADAIIFYSGCDICNLSPINYYYNDIFNDMGWHPDLYFCEINSKKRFIISYINIMKKISGRSWIELGKSISIGIKKFEAFNLLDQVFYSIRPSYYDSKEPEMLYNKLFEELVLAKSIKSIKFITHDLLNLYKMQAKLLPDNVLRVGLVGDTFTLSEPYIHHYIDKQLGHLGVVVDRWSEHRFLPQYILKNKGNLSCKSELLESIFRNDYGVFTSLELLKLYRYIDRDYDGIMFLSPFECNPNDALRNLLHTVQSELDFPILTMVFDEHTCPAGIIARVEAFVDLLNKRKISKTARAPHL